MSHDAAEKLLGRRRGGEEIVAKRGLGSEPGPLLPEEACRTGRFAK